MVTKSRKPWSVRLPGGLLARIRAAAKAHKISPSAAARMALQRGLREIEFDKDPSLEKGVIQPLAVADEVSRRGSA
jgi:hypothetical protein